MYIAAMHFPFLLRGRFFRWRASLLFSAALLLVAVTASAQQMPAGHDMGDMLPITPPDKLPGARTGGKIGQSTAQQPCALQRIVLLLRYAAK